MPSELFSSFYVCELGIDNYFSIIVKRLKNTHLNESNNTCYNIIINLRGYPDDIKIYKYLHAKI